jgi:hypothetical protein
MVAVGRRSMFGPLSMVGEVRFLTSELCPNKRASTTLPETTLQDYVLT